MTIKHNGRALTEPADIPIKPNMLDVLIGGPKPTLTAFPDPEGVAERDQVVRYTSYGIFEITGPAIVNNRICKKYGVTWSKER